MMAREVKPRTQPAIQLPDVRRRNFDEVIKGYTLEEAMAESARCILCKNARCQAACPLHNQIPSWMAQLQQGNLEEAYKIIRQISPMPELCSRLCPQERLCEGSCAIGIKNEPVAIGLLERFICDQNRDMIASIGQEARAKTKSDRKRVAAIGSGPASLAFAQRMALEGHDVIVFERWPRLGGVLRWIPRFKLPIDVLELHLDMLKGLGVKFYTNTEVRWVEQLITDEGFDGAFIGIGASTASIPDIPGVSFGGILSSTEFLVRTFYDKKELPEDWEPIADLIGKNVAVLGGGDSAMDCVRSGIRLGAANVTCVYRRDEANMPGSKKEVKAAKEEGVDFQILASPTAFLSKDGHAVSQVECVRMELGAPDASGRRSPKPISGSNFFVDADIVVLAFGYEVEAVFDIEHLQLMAPPKGTIKANPISGATPLKGIFAGGDCVSGANLVCTAAKAGIAAAQGMLRYFQGENWDALMKAEGAPTGAKTAT